MSKPRSLIVFVAHCLVVLILIAPLYHIDTPKPLQVWQVALLGQLISSTLWAYQQFREPSEENYRIMISLFWFPSVAVITYLLVVGVFTPMPQASLSLAAFGSALILWSRVLRTPLVKKVALSPHL